MKIVHYKVIQESESKLVSVVAPNTTYAKEMISQRYPNHSIHYYGTSDEILQINGQFNMVVSETAVTEL
jgi:hypothetical protein